MQDFEISPRILDAINCIRETHHTPFFLYDAQSITRQHNALSNAFRGLDFQQYFAVKALPRPQILRHLAALGSGFDCASLVEVGLARDAGCDLMMFTSNNTTTDQFRLACEAGASIVVDDISLLPRVGPLVKDLSFRVTFQDGVKDSIVGGDRSKFGMTPDQVVEACGYAVQNGQRRVGLHCMQIANLTDCQEKVSEALKLIDFAARVQSETGCTVSSLNFGGGAGLPYRPSDTEFDVIGYANRIKVGLTERFDILPQVRLEWGRYVTGPSGYLISEVTGVFHKPHRVIGINVSTATVPRVTVYPDAYHHLSFPFAGDKTRTHADVVGGMCESKDKFCEERLLPVVGPGDVCIMHDVGAHAIAMSNTYNGMLRPAEFFVQERKITCITRAETAADFSSRFIDETVGYCDAQDRLA